jgi:hypothetical protein
MEIHPPSADPDVNASQPNLLLLAAKVVLTLISIPLMRMELFTQFLPKWLSDYSYGLMFRLGILFGLVVLVWQVGLRRELLRARSIVFLLASVASALLAVWLGGFVRGDPGMWVIILSGALCLSLTQKFIFSTSWKQVVAAIILAPGFFYLVSFANDKFVHQASAQEFIGSFMPYYWQLGYLLGMFGILDLIKKNAPADH